MGKDDCDDKDGKTTGKDYEECKKSSKRPKKVSSADIKCDEEATIKPKYELPGDKETAHKITSETGDRKTAERITSEKIAKPAKKVYKKVEKPKVVKKQVATQQTTVAPKSLTEISSLFQNIMNSFLKLFASKSKGPSKPGGPPGTPKLDLKTLDFKNFNLEELRRNMPGILEHYFGKPPPKKTVLFVGRRPMKFPYTFTAKVMQFPYRYYYYNCWIYKYYIVGIIVCLPIFKYFSSLANSKENVAKWREIRRLEASEGHR